MVSWVRRTSAPGQDPYLDLPVLNLPVQLLAGLEDCPGTALVYSVHGVGGLQLCVSHLGFVPAARRLEILVWSGIRRPAWVVCGNGCLSLFFSDLPYPGAQASRLQKCRRDACAPRLNYFWLIFRVWKRLVRWLSCLVWI